MKRGLIAFLLCAALPAMADHPVPERTVAVDRRELRQELDALSHLLDELAHERRPHRRTRLASRARARIDAMRRELREAPRVDVPLPFPPQPPPPVVAPPPPPAPQPIVYPIAQPALEELKNALRRESFPRDRLRVLDAASPVNWFLVPQVQEVLAMFEFPRDRLQAMRLLKPRVLDVEQFYRLYGSFEFPSDKAELKKILNQ